MNILAKILCQVSLFGSRIEISLLGVEEQKENKKKKQIKRKSNANPKNLLYMLIIVGFMHNIKSNIFIS